MGTVRVWVRVTLTEPWLCSVLSFPEIEPSYCESGQIIILVLYMTPLPRLSLAQFSVRDSQTVDTHQQDRHILSQQTSKNTADTEKNCKKKIFLFWPHRGKNDYWNMMSRPTDVLNDSFVCYQDLSEYVGLENIWRGFHCEPALKKHY